MCTHLRLVQWECHEVTLVVNHITEVANQSVRPAPHPEVRHALAGVTSEHGGGPGEQTRPIGREGLGGAA